ncbi:MAG: helix-turn-helix domain-containing protein [Clostridia bacterium]|nr:helix-turn-helix domain-containing protein [Clostridia bacterium]
MLPFVRYIDLTQSLPNPYYVISRDHRLFFVLEGAGFYHTGSQSFPLSPNTLVFSQPGVPYFPESAPHNPLRFYTLNFDFDQSYSNLTQVLPPTRSDLRLPGELLTTPVPQELTAFHSAFFLEHMQALEFEFHAIHSEYVHRDLLFRQRSSALLAALLYKINRYASSGQSSVQNSDRILSFIHANYAKPLKNTHIGAALGYHPGYVSTLVKSRTGKPLHRYLLEVRLQKAVTLLLDTTLSVAEIARQVGFIDANHFSAAFHRWSGQRPTDYRYHR